jgi:hypothetical protein
MGLCHSYEDDVPNGRRTKRRKGKKEKVKGLSGSGKKASDPAKPNTAKGSGKKGGARQAGPSPRPGDDFDAVLQPLSILKRAHPQAQSRTQSASQVEFVGIPPITVDSNPPVRRGSQGLNSLSLASGGSGASPLVPLTTAFVVASAPAPASVPRLRKTTPNPGRDAIAAEHASFTRGSQDVLFVDVTSPQVYAEPPTSPTCSSVGVTGVVGDADDDVGEVYKSTLSTTHGPSMRGTNLGGRASAAAEDLSFGFDATQSVSAKSGSPRGVEPPAFALLSFNTSDVTIGANADAAAAHAAVNPLLSEMPLVDVDPHTPQLGPPTEGSTRSLSDGRRLGSDYPLPDSQRNSAVEVLVPLHHVIGEAVPVKGHSSMPPLAPVKFAPPKDAVIVTIKGQQYNLASLLATHPGGAAVLRQHQGQDATQTFFSSHSPAPLAALRKYEYPRREL